MRIGVIRSGLKHAIYGSVAGAFVAISSMPVPARVNYPVHAIKIVVPVPAGPTLDLLPRIIANALSSRWGQPIVIENRPGAAQMLGAEAVAKAAPDAYTLLASPPGPLVVAQSFYKTLRFDPAAFVPISIFASQPVVLIARPNLPVTNFAALIAYAKAHPDKLTYGSPGVGSILHLEGEMLKIDAGIQMVHVPYPGLAPVLTDIMAGRIDLAFASAGNVLANERLGKLRILAVGSKVRIPELPTTPSIVESFPGFQSASWFALVAPPKTLPETAALVSQAISETLHKPDVRMKFRALSVDPLGTSPEETAAFLKQEAARWRAVIEKARIVQR